ncbi:ASKHA domain-containing protein [Sporomusa acidovorans]|uniref:Na(+)-translocating NADH-quinone reductase subunit F n=1 Tax=Sporomusa acidovorans (strain ATCC 49682 / DSM 3132 / Mol) TaxID=1123286 RepID=A0ABZ3J257_SPOA4|nr:ASKHA domain-containing protein [Sporomusa acidovorans]OZC24008.1 Na(+)-translocating NADH-quinone reductase subunit F [Sporomusa acidovorans DSM 3132]SDF83541.1 Uncharacterized 2Fe-2 and 4Fe-4S clusters-containing protein, contains DUF4445 domain [Sporomusa acidovorans]
MTGCERGNKSKVIIEYQPTGRRVQAEIGQTVLAAALGLELFSHGIYAPCGGKGLCGQCQIRLVSGQLTIPSEHESKRLSKEQLEQGYRLACQARVLSDCKVELPVTSLIGRQQLQVDGCGAKLEPDYPVRWYAVSNLQKPSLQYPHSLWQQLERIVAEKYGKTGLVPSISLMRRVDCLAAYEDDARVAVRGNEIVDIVTLNSKYCPLGLAVDLGTTKIAAFLVVLNTGEVLAADGILNPQIAFGEDVMSRLAFAMENGENAKRLAGAAADGINELAERLAARCGFAVSRISEAVIVANTAMHHLLLELPIKQLALSPYIPAATVSLTIHASTIGLKLGCEAKVYTTALVGGFVGSDHVAMIQASGIDKAKGVVLGIDIGTNTEIVLAGKGTMLACSCASGPAFEGGHIYQGMRAVDGAISEVSFDSHQKINIKTIGAQKPIGLCGSGIIDLVAGLNKAGIIAANGRLDLSHPRVRVVPGDLPEFLVVPRSASGCGNDIVITQKDIGEIQLGKAAIMSGINLLLKSCGITVNEVEKVIIAGAFGSFLQIESAIDIGMLPQLPIERFVQVGNAAGTGACMGLVSMRERRRSEAIAKKIEHLDLAVLPEFKREYAKALKFLTLKYST